VLKPPEPEEDKTGEWHVILRMDWIVALGAVVFAVMTALTVCQLFLPESPP
jgi:hypothetical protein